MLSNSHTKNNSLSSKRQKQNTMTEKALYQIPRKKIRRSADRITSAAFLHNKFDALSTDDEEPMDIEIQNRSRNTHKNTTGNSAQKKPPPIIVTDEKYNKIELILKDTNIEKYCYKQITMGLKIFVDTKEDYNALLESLAERKIEFFTHRFSEEKIIKVVLYGLPKMEVSELKACFATELNIRPLEIFLMKTKSENVHNTLYLVHLNKKEISFNDLLKIKAINHTIVNWMPYKYKRRGPTICNKCLMYGHGAQNCMRTPHCQLCAGNHEMKNCGLSANNNTGTIVYKCFNCTKHNIQNNHRANDIACPFREEFINMKNKTGNKSNLPEQNAIQQPIAKQQRPTQHYRNTYTQEKSYADQLRNNSNQTNHSDDELFSMSELLNIFKNAVSKIKQCKTKLDQITVIASLLEYAI